MAALTPLDVMLALNKMAAAVLARVEAAERRVAAIEGRGVDYKGVHQRGAQYQRGDLVTHGGSMWCATQATSETPGVDGQWQLAVKRGRDAR